MASMGKYQCANPNCRVMFEARTADRARGYARSCSKSCASVVRIMQSPKENMFAQAETLKRFEPPNWDTNSDGGGWD